ncbi:hypothetical protein OROHE_022831 [Orobanche hederae]
MKFMKLGSRPDIFYTTDTVRSVSSEVSSDLIIQVKGSRYLLHKYPMLSKSLLLQKLCSEIPEKTSPLQIVQLPKFPGGIESFELCAKFCYGITITLSAHNIVSILCAADYLQMTEEVENGNLMQKLEVFFGSCILNGWRDVIVALQTTKDFPLWSEELGITSRCVESIASKILADPSRTLSRHNDKGWWGEDLAELGIDLYWRTMIAARSGGKVPPVLIGEALRIYMSRWLPDLDTRVESDDCEEISKNRLLLESVISLLPADTGAVSSGFLMKLLKASDVLKACSSSRTELARRVGLQLEETTVGDLLVPCLAKNENGNGAMYDVDIVMTMLEQFMSRGQSPQTSPPRRRDDFLERRRRSRSSEHVDWEFEGRRRSSSASHSCRLKVAKLVDSYLQEIAKDENLPLSKFIAIAEVIPGYARVEHDHLYKAIDIYLKGHPELDKSERKRLCRILDCKKLSMEACRHAAQNEMLPLRVVVQVLFFEHARATMAGGQVTELPTNIKALLAGNKVPSIQKTVASFRTNTVVPREDQWSTVSGFKSPKCNLSTLKMKLAEDDDDDDLYDDFPDGVGKSPKFKSLCMIPTGPKRIFSKLWPITRRSSSEKK